MRVHDWIHLRFCLANSGAQKTSREVAPHPLSFNQKHKRRVVANVVSKWQVFLLESSETERKRSRMVRHCNENLKKIAHWSQTESKSQKSAWVRSSVSGLFACWTATYHNHSQSLVCALHKGKASTRAPRRWDLRASISTNVNLLSKMQVTAIHLQFRASGHTTGCKAQKGTWRNLLRSLPGLPSILPFRWMAPWHYQNAGFRQQAWTCLSCLWKAFTLVQLLQIWGSVKSLNMASLPAALAAHLHSSRQLHCLSHVQAKTPADLDNDSKKILQLLSSKLLYRFGVPSQYSMPQHHHKRPVFLSSASAFCMAKLSSTYLNGRFSFCTRRPLWNTAISSKIPNLKQKGWETIFLQALEANLKRTRPWSALHPAIAGRTKSG